MAVITLMQEYIQLPQESVRAYANRVKANWRQARCNLQMHEDVLYDTACAGLHKSLMNTVVLMTPSHGRFHSLEEFFDKAVASEVTHVDNNNPQPQQQQEQQQRQKQLTDLSSEGGKQMYRPSISERVNTSGRGQSGQSGSNRHIISGCAGQ